MITRVNAQILRIHPIYEFRDFPENGHSSNGYFHENFWKTNIGWIRKNPRIHPSYHCCDFSLNVRISAILRILPFHNEMGDILWDLNPCQCWIDPTRNHQVSVYKQWESNFQEWMNMLWWWSFRHPILDYLPWFWHAKLNIRVSQGWNEGEHRVKWSYRGDILGWKLWWFIWLSMKPSKWFHLLKELVFW